MTPAPTISNPQIQEFVDLVIDSGNDDSQIEYIEEDAKVFIDFGSADEFEFTLAEFDVVQAQLPNVYFAEEA